MKVSEFILILKNLQFCLKDDPEVVFGTYGEAPVTNVLLRHTQKLTGATVDDKSFPHKQIPELETEVTVVIL